MLERSFVLFKSLAEKKPDVSNRQYLVAVKDTDAEADFKICTWYEKGDAVFLTYKPECSPKAITAEERLLNAIFSGANKRVIVKESGFYLVTADYGCDDPDNDDCVNDLIRIDSDNGDGNIFWAELPFAPADAVHPYDAQNKRDRENKRRMRENLEAYTADLEVFLSSDPIIAEVGGLESYKSIMDEEKAGLGRRVTRGMVVEFSYVDYLESLAASALLVRAGRLIQSEYNDDFITLAAAEWKASKSLDKYEEMRSYVHNNLFGKDSMFKSYYRRMARLKSSVDTLIHIIFMSTAEQLADPNHYVSTGLRKTVYTHLKEQFEEPRVFGVFTADCTRRIRNCIVRYAKLSDLGAPVIILMNEFRILAENMRYLYQDIVKAAEPADAIAEFGTNEADYGGCYDFGSYYGVNTDGTNAYYDPPCTSGDYYPVTENGLHIVPYIGVDKDGNEVRYSEYRHSYVPGDSKFVCAGGREFNIIKTSTVLPASSNVHIDIVSDHTGRVPDIGTDSDGNEVRYDASVHTWNTGDDSFSDIEELDDTGNRVSDVKSYAIKSYREFPLP